MIELTPETFTVALDDPEAVVWCRLRYEHSARFHAARKTLLALGAQYKHWCSAWIVPDDADVDVLQRLHAKTSAVFYSAHVDERITKDMF